MRFLFFVLIMCVVLSSLACQWKGPKKLKVVDPKGNEFMLSEEEFELKLQKDGYTVEVE